MRLFILTDTKLAVSRAILFQKVIDIIEAGANAAHLQFYIVSNHFPIHFKELFLRSHQVTLLNQLQAEQLIGEVTNASILHFGAELKGSAQFPHYFIPLTHPGLATDFSFLKRISHQFAFKSYLKKATSVFCLNDWAFNSLQFFYKQYASLFKPAFLPTAALPTFEWTQLSEVKNDFSDGNNYFLAFVPIDHFVDTLKEFSIFKKWQQTSMSIVFVFDNETQLQEAVTLLKGYKYKDAVVLKNSAALSQAWIAATYAILFDGVDFDKTVIMEWGIFYDIPLLFNFIKSQPDSWNKAGSVFSFSEQSALASHFKLYYKDEVYRQARAKMGKEWLQLLLSDRLQKGLPNLINELKG
jgi:hypothetical protein